MAETERAENPLTLVAIALGARRTGDRALEREMRDRLRRDHGVAISFPRRPVPQGAKR